MVVVSKKDILNLVYLSEYFGLNEVASFWESVVNLNNWHQHRLSQLIVKKLFGTVSGKRISILGFAFKSNTNDTRESAAITICKDLLEEGAILNIHDPKVEPCQIEKDLKIKNDNIIFNTKDIKDKRKDGTWTFCKNIIDSVNGTDAVIVLTEWEDYRQINWYKASSKMRRPAWVFDARSITNAKKIKDAGLNLWRIGDGTN